MGDTIQILKEAGVTVEEMDFGMSNEMLGRIWTEVLMAKDYTLDALYINFMHPARETAEAALMEAVGTDRCDGLAGSVMELKNIVLNGEPLAYLCVGSKGAQEAFWVFKGMIETGIF